MERISEPAGSAGEKSRATGRAPENCTSALRIPGCLAHDQIQFLRSERKLADRTLRPTRRQMRRDPQGPLRHIRVQSENAVYKAGDHRRFREHLMRDAV